MRSIRRLNWCALYGMCRCFHLPYIGCMETRCSILIWHAAVLGKHFHFLKNLLIFLFCLFGSSLFLQLFFCTYGCGGAYSMDRFRSNGKTKKSHIKRYSNKIWANLSTANGFEICDVLTAILLMQNKTEYYIIFYRKKNIYISKWNSVEMIMKRFWLHVVNLPFYFPIPEHLLKYVLFAGKDWMTHFIYDFADFIFFPFCGWQQATILFQEMSSENSTWFIKHKLFDDKIQTWDFVNGLSLV